jgi:hypothetical protein
MIFVLFEEIHQIHPSIFIHFFTLEICNCRDAKIFVLSEKKTNRQKGRLNYFKK